MDGNELVLALCLENNANCLLPEPLGSTAPQEMIGAVLVRVWIVVLEPAKAHLPGVVVVLGIVVMVMCAKPRGLVVFEPRTRLRGG